MKKPTVKRDAYLTNPPFEENVPTPSRNMAGKGAPKSTTFGVIHQMKNDPYTRSLGGLVQDTKDLSPEKAGTMMKASPRMFTERDILGNVGKTQVAKVSYGQVPYAGRFMTEAGHKMS
jgi:hypothetical protein